MDTGTVDTGAGDSTADSVPDSGDSEPGVGDSDVVQDSGEHTGLVQPKGCDCSAADRSAVPILGLLGLLGLLLWPVRRVIR